MLKTVFVDNDKVSVEEIVHTLYSLVNGWYEKGGFWVLPYRAVGEGKSVYLPRIDGWDWGWIERKLGRVNRVDIPVKK